VGSGPLHRGAVYFGLSDYSEEEQREIGCRVRERRRAQR
jgi:hypothetical protein